MTPLLDPIPAKIALRTSVAVMAAFLLGQSTHLFNSYWILVTIFILINADASAVWTKAALRMVGTLAAAFTGVGLLCLFIQHPLLLVFSLFVCFTLCGYGASGKVYPYAFLIASITLAFIVALGWKTPANIFYLSVFRPLDVLLGILLLWVCSRLLLPEAFRKDIRHLCLEHLRTVLSTVREQSLALCSLQPWSPEKSIGNLDRIDTLQQIILRLESSRNRHSTELQEELAAITALRSMLIKLSTIRIDPPADGSPLLPEPARKPFEAVITSVESRLLTLIRCLEKNIPVPEPLPGAARTECGDFFETIRQWRREHQAEVNRTYPVLRFVEKLSHLSHFLDQCADHLRRSRLPQALPGGGDHPLREIARQVLGSFSPIDTPRLLQGLKQGLAMSLVFLAYFILPWPGLVLCMSTVIVVMQPTMGSAWRMLMQRLVGTLMGTAFGLFCFLFIYPHMEGAWTFLPFLGAYAFWIAYNIVARPNQSALFILAGFSYVLCALGGFQTPGDMTNFFNAAGGVMAGCLLGGAVNLLLWPVQARTLMRAKLAEIISLIREILPLAFDPAESPGRIRDRSLSIQTRLLTLSAEASGLARDVHSESGQWVVDPVRFRNLQTSLKLIPLLIVESGFLWRQCRDSALYRDTFAPEVNSLIAALPDWLADLEHNLGSGRRPESPQPLRDCLEALNTRINAHCRSPDHALFEKTAHWVAFSSLVEVLRQLTETAEALPLEWGFIQINPRAPHLLLRALRG
ncbi:MAG: FUSC family protein [Verrucomicrobiae bacterium]|nr:FUSC family protein [Verrucomicrobiae bacterium]